MELEGLSIQVDLKKVSTMGLGKEGRRRRRTSSIYGRRKVLFPVLKSSSPYSPYPARAFEGGYELFSLDSQSTTTRNNRVQDWKAFSGAKDESREKISTLPPSHVLTRLCARSNKSWITKNLQESRIRKITESIRKRKKG